MSLHLHRKQTLYQKERMLSGIFNQSNKEWCLYELLVSRGVMEGIVSSWFMGTNFWSVGADQPVLRRQTREEYV